MERIGILKSIGSTNLAVLNPSSKSDDTTQREDATTLTGQALRDLHEVEAASVYGDIKDIEHLMKIYKEEELAEKTNSSTGTDKKTRGRRLNPIARQPRKQIPIQEDQIKENGKENGRERE